MKIKIWAFGNAEKGDPIEWIAAATREEAIEEYKEMTDYTPENDGPTELPDSDMDTLQVYHEEPDWNDEKGDYDYGDSSSFRVYLEKLIAEGTVFPSHFSCSEW